MGLLVSAHPESVGFRFVAQGYFTRYGCGLNQPCLFGLPEQSLAYPCVTSKVVVVQCGQHIASVDSYH